MNKLKPELGQTLYSLKVRNVSHNERRLTPVTVTKVGRKYFYCAEERFKDTEHCWVQYYINTWRQVTDYSASYVLYASENEYNEQKEKTELYDKIRKLFRHLSYHNDFTLNQLREINKIIEGNDVKQS